MALYLALTVQTKALVDEEAFGAALVRVVGKSGTDKADALRGTIFDQETDPTSLSDAVARAVVAERLVKARVVYFLKYRSAEAYIFGEGLTKHAESARRRLMYALSQAGASVLSADAEVKTGESEQVILKGRRSSKWSRAKKVVREGVFTKVVPAVCTYFIALWGLNISNLQSLTISIVTATLTLLADMGVAMYREGEWMWTGAQS